MPGLINSYQFPSHNRNSSGNSSDTSPEEGYVYLARLVENISRLNNNRSLTIQFGEPLVTRDNEDQEDIIDVTDILESNNDELLNGIVRLINRKENKKEEKNVNKRYALR